MNWIRQIQRLRWQGGSLLSDVASDVRLLLDTSQINLRTRRAWKQGRTALVCYLLIDHQRRRIIRRREIRRLVNS